VTLPIGVELSRTAKQVSREFERALAGAGGTVPAWLVLVALKRGRPETQAQLAGAVGVEAATLTHHLNRMEGAGLLTRARDPENRRVHRVELTPAGEAAFERLRAVVRGFDAQLRAGFTEEELAALRGLLGRLAANAAGSAPSG
jgi:MarR family transcriptional regulator for hemolysin